MSRPAVASEGMPSIEGFQAGEWSPAPPAPSGAGVGAGAGVHSAAYASSPELQHEADMSPPPSPPRLGLGANTWLQTREDGSFQQLSADNYYGQRDARGLPHGRGIRLTPQGQIICRQCGQWADGVLLKERSVARSLLPAYTPLAERVQSADLLLSDGSFYVGSLNAHNLPHGPGTRYGVDDLDVQRYVGEWWQGQQHGLGALTLSDGSVHEGEFVEGDANGFGILFAADGVLLECGVYEDDQLVAPGPVPRCMIPVGTFLSDHARTATLLFPDGTYYVGDVNAHWQRHGEGSMHSAATGSMMDSGVWHMDEPLLSADAEEEPSQSVRASQRRANRARQMGAGAGDFEPDPFSVGDSLELSFSGASANSGSGSSIQPGGASRAHGHGHGHGHARSSRSSRRRSAAPVVAPTTCVVCKAAQRDCLVDCPHFVLCMACATKATHCPICNAPITQRQHRRIELA